MVHHLIRKQLADRAADAALTHVRIKEELAAAREVGMDLDFILSYVARITGYLKEHHIPYNMRGFAADSQLFYEAGLQHYDPVHYRIPCQLFYYRLSGKDTFSLDINIPKDCFKDMLSAATDGYSVRKPSTGDPDHADLLVITFCSENAEPIADTGESCNSVTVDLCDERYHGAKPFRVTFCHYRDIDEIWRLQNITGKPALEHPELEDHIFTPFGTMNLDGLGVFDTPLFKDHYKELLPHCRTVTDIVKLLGLSFTTHTYMWDVKMQIEDHEIPLSDVIASREDAYTELVACGIAPDDACVVVFGKDLPLASETVLKLTPVRKWLITLQRPCLPMPAGQLYDYAWCILNLAHFRIMEESAHDKHKA